MLPGNSFSTCFRRGVKTSRPWCSLWRQASCRRSEKDHCKRKPAPSAPTLLFAGGRAGGDDEEEMLRCSYPAEVGARAGGGKRGDLVVVQSVVLHLAVEFI